MILVDIFSYFKADTEVFVNFYHTTDDRRPVTGYLCILAGASISCQSQSQTTVALSSMEAEYMAACATTQESF